MDLAPRRELALSGERHVLYRHCIFPKHRQYGWHWARADKTIACDPDTVVEPGKVYSYLGTEPPKVGVRGMHSATNILDALQSIRDCSVACFCHVWGQQDRDGTILATRHRKVLWMVDATELLTKPLLSYKMLADRQEVSRELERLVRSLKI